MRVRFSCLPHLIFDENNNMEILKSTLHPGVKFKLKSDNYKWSDDYIDRLIEEYKKFLYLSTVVDFKVTPSFPIDQA